VDENTGVSEREGFNVPINIIGHFRDESFQSIICTGTDKQPNKNNQEAEQKT